ncbi:hypothetical protein NFI96_008371 [Prochilodus magdalenae]|nr:hypothetical protein NFI96_008371 [Prochilodus magdalenae]
MITSTRRVSADKPEVRISFSLDDPSVGGSVVSQQEGTPAGTPGVLSVWGLPVPPVSVWVSSWCCGFRPQVQRHAVRLIEDAHWTGDSSCPNQGRALSLYLTDPTATIADIQEAVVSSMGRPVSAAPLSDGCTTQDYMHTDRYHDCP